MAKQNRRQYLVSTDSLGFLGKPEQFIYLWKEYFNDKTLDGVEAIAFKPINRLKTLVSVLNRHHIPVISFHGKTGGEEKLTFFPRVIMTLVNKFILDINKLFNNFPDIEFLSHSLYFKKNIVFQTILKKKPDKFWIENHLQGKEGIEKNIEEILRYRKNNINSLGMFDVYHFVSHMKLKGFLENWDKIVDQIEDYFKLKDLQGRPIFRGIHFPIGSRLGDSLPIDRMTDDMLQLFAQRIVPFAERIVLENQQKNLGLFFSTNKMIQEQKIRNKRIVERLKKTGIIY